MSSVESRLASIESRLTGRAAGEVPASVGETDPGTESTF